jgi:hypothetical protein
MNYRYKILFRSLVKPFYRENANLFLFVFAVMFFIVGELDGIAGLFEYHQSLATGMLSSISFLLLVFAGWFLYVRKCMAFVTTKLQHPSYSFLHVYNSLNRFKRIQSFLFVECWLLLPVFLYGIFVIITGWQHHLYLPALCVALYMLVLCGAATIWHVKVLNSPYHVPVLPWQKIQLRLKLPSSYPVTLLRFVLHQQKILWITLKVFTCGTLYLIVSKATANELDTRFTFLLFSFGLFGHGVLLFRIRQFEEMYLRAYRSLPVTRIKRLLQYCLVYFVLLLPEFITTALLSPVHLYYADAIQFSLAAYSLLLLANSISFIPGSGGKEFPKILFLVFCVQYILLMAAGLAFLSLIFFCAAVILFLSMYYQFEPETLE